MCLQAAGEARVDAQSLHVITHVRSVSRDCDLRVSLTFRAFLSISEKSNWYRKLAQWSGHLRS